MTEDVKLDCAKCGENNWELASITGSGTVIATCAHCNHTMNIIVRISFRNVEK